MYAGPTLAAPPAAPPTGPPRSYCARSRRSRLSRSSSARRDSASGGTHSRRSRGAPPDDDDACAPLASCAPPCAAPSRRGGPFSFGCPTINFVASSSASSRRLAAPDAEPGARAAVELLPPAAVDISAIFADVFGEEHGRAAPPSGVIEDRAERFAREAAEYWLENMRRVGADEKALSHFGVDRQHLGWLIDELIVALQKIRDMGTALLLVEQHISMIQKVAHRYIALRKGELVGDGPVEDLNNRDVQEMIAL